MLKICTTFGDFCGIGCMQGPGLPRASYYSCRRTTNGSINFVIGFDKNYNSSAITHTSVNPPSLAKHVLYIDIDQLSSNHTSSFINSTSNVFEVPNNVNKNEIIFYNEKTNFRQSVNCKSNSEIIYNLSVKIKDQFNQIVTGLSDFSLILAFY